MKGKNVRMFFRQIAIWQVKYRFIILFFVLAISFAGFTGLHKVQILSDEKNLIAKTEEHSQKVKQFEETFGNSESIVLLFESSDVFQLEVLKAIKAIGEELMEKVPGAKSVMSITDIELTIGNEEGIEIFRPFQDEIPTDTKDIEHLRSLILNKKNLVNKLVSKDCTESWVILSLHPFPEESDENGRQVLAPMYKAGREAISIVENEKWKSDKYTIKAAGMPYTETEEREVIKKETTRTVLISFSVMVVLLMIFTMSFIGTLIPVAALLLGIGVVFGFMGHFGIVADSNMVSIPILLAMALSVGYSIHLINSFKHYFYISGKRKEAVVESIEETGWPLFFTVVTTIASVLSFLTTSLYPLRWLGAACAATILSVYFYTSIIIPIVMSFGRDIDTSRISKKAEAKIFNMLDKQFVRFGYFVIEKRRIVLIISFLVFLLCIPGILKLQIKMDGYTFMGLRIPYIQRIDHIANSKLGSYFNYNVMLSFDNSESLKEPTNLRKLEELEAFINTFKYTKKTDDEAKIFSILGIVKEMNQTLHEDNPAFYKLPDTRSELAEIFLLYELSGGQLSKWIDDDYKTTRMRVEVSKFDSEELSKNIELLNVKGSELFPDAHTFLIGEAVDFADINVYIVNGELSSMTASLFAIFILMWLVFGSFKLSLIGMIPNIAPLFAIGAVMGYCGIYLDMITMTIMPMLLGISVDDTIYFISHAKFEYMQQKDYSKSTVATFKSIGKTLLATSIILCIGFATNAVSLLSGIVRIGLLGSFGFFIALIADYFLTPILIYITKPFDSIQAECN